MIMHRMAHASPLRRIWDSLSAKWPAATIPLNDGATRADPTFVQPWNVTSADECDFYHTMDIPDHGPVSGQWDLRDHVDEYLGGYSFANKRVLEIGPASGFLTFELEKRGASVVSIDVRDDRCWDFVPYPDSVLAPVLPVRFEHIKRLKNSYWFAHRKFRSRSQVWYGDVYNIPDEFGKFDVAVMSAVLLHVSNPLLLMQECAKRSSALIVTDLLYEDLEGKPVCRLRPTGDNKHWDTWWDLSSDFIGQFASVLGFTDVTKTRHEQRYLTAGAKWPFFTVLATR